MEPPHTTIENMTPTIDRLAEPLEQRKILNHSPSTSPLLAQHAKCVCSRRHAISVSPSAGRESETPKSISSLRKSSPDILTDQLVRRTRIQFVKSSTLAMLQISANLNYYRRYRIRSKIMTHNDQEQVGDS